MSYNGNIFQIQSKYLLNDIFSNLKYRDVLNIVKYNKALQNKLNIQFSDYIIDYKLQKKQEEKAVGEYMINQNNNNEKNIILWLNIIIKGILFFVIFFNFMYWRTNAYNIILAFELVFIFLQLFFYLIKKCFGTKVNSLIYCGICDGIIYSIFLIIIILKYVSDKKRNEPKEVYIYIITIDIIMIILLCIIIIFKFTIFFLLKNDKDLPMLTRQKKIFDKVEIVISRFKGFKINEYICPFFYDLKPLNNETINTILKYLIYSLSKSQEDLINSINELRVNNNIPELLYEPNEKIIDYFLNIEHFYFKDNIVKFSNNNYLFIYKIGQFKKELIKTEEKINIILLEKYLNRIIILEKEFDEYILIFNDNKFRKNNHEIIDSKSEIILFK